MSELLNIGGQMFSELYCRIHVNIKKTAVYSSDTFIFYCHVCELTTTKFVLVEKYVQSSRRHWS
jgi:hypothetical protein